MATFFDRMGAYIIDMCIISFLLSLICFNLPSDDKYQKQMTELNDKYIASEITVNKYIEEYQTIIYDHQKSNIISSCANIALSVAYIIVFAYLYKGQTLGKKLFKIRVIDKNSRHPASLIQMTIRSLFIYDIASSIISIMCLFILPGNYYLFEYVTLSTIISIFTIVSLFFIINRKDKCGLHDLMAGTIVIKERG